MPCLRRLQCAVCSIKIRTNSRNNVLVITTDMPCLRRLQCAACSIHRHPQPRRSCHTCEHLCVHACVHVCLWVCGHACAHVCMHACMAWHSCVRTCVHGVREYCAGARGAGVPSLRHVPDDLDLIVLEPLRKDLGSR